MAFLDNSGTIILDAILTDTGRKRMSQGRFEISKFSLGDDEMDYGLVDVDSADYSKLTTLPSFEALNNKNAVINYNLCDYPSDDIFYIPQIKVNGKLRDSVRRNRPGAETFLRKF